MMISFFYKTVIFLQLGYLPFSSSIQYVPWLDLLPLFGSFLCCSCHVLYVCVRVGYDLETSVFFAIQGYLAALDFHPIKYVEV